MGSTKVVQRGPMSPAPSFPKGYILLYYNIKSNLRKLTLVQSVWIVLDDFTTCRSVRVLRHNPDTEQPMSTRTALYSHIHLPRHGPTFISANN